MLGMTCPLERMDCRPAESSVPKKACNHLSGLTELSARLGMKGLDL
jgi:hypothetical protein